MKKILLILFLLSLGSLAVGAGVVLNAFHSGVLSPRTGARSDIREYYRGCRELENMVVIAQGPVVKRPGTHYIADANIVTAVRLVPFTYSTDESYAIELGNTYMRFYKEQ